MSESTPSGDWLTVSQAAQVLGISERQARRYAHKLADGDRQVLGGAGHGTGHTSGVSPARVRLSAMVEARARATGSTRSTADERKTSVKEGPDTTPDTRPAQAGHGAGHVLPDAGHEAGHVTALLSEKDARIADLRATVDAQRLQIEAANRTAAEATAALREYIRTQPKQLPGGAPVAAQDVPTTNASQTTRGADQDAVRATQREKTKPWQRAVMRIIGAR